MPAAAAAAAAAAQLPPLLCTTSDVLVEVSDYLPGRDVLQFTNSCRVLRSHFAASRFWQRRLVSAGYAEGARTGSSVVPASLVPPVVADAVVHRMLIASSSGECPPHPAGAEEVTHGNGGISAAGAPLVRTVAAEGQWRWPQQSRSPTAATASARHPAHVDPLADDDADAADNVAGTEDRPPRPGQPRVLGSAYRTHAAVQSATVTAKHAYAMLDYAFRTCRAKPVATTHPPLLECAEAPEREGAAVCTLSNGHAVYMRSGFCNDPFVWVYSYPMEAVRVWVPENLLRGTFQTTPLTEHDPVVYGHRVTTISEDDHVAQYGGLTSGGYQGAVPNLCVSWALDRGGGSEKLGDLEEGRVERVAMLQADTARLLRTVVFEIGHPRFPARSFHGQCLDPSGRYLYLFGGLLEGGRVDNTLLVIDVAALMNCVHLAAEIVAQPNQRDAMSRARTLREHAWREFVVGEPVKLPSVRPRFGHSMTLIGDRIYIAGGYTGSGMFRLHDGDDLTDIYVLKPPVLPPADSREEERRAATSDDDDDDDAAESRGRWSVSVTQVTPRANAIKGFLGRCHTGTAFGPYIAFFGGTQHYSARLVLFDTRDQTLRKHALGIAAPPESSSHRRAGSGRHTVARVSHCAALSGSLLVISGGCSFDQSVMDDFAVDLCPPPCEATARLPRMTIQAITSYEGDAHEATIEAYHDVISSTSDEESESGASTSDVSESAGSSDADLDADEVDEEE